MKVLRYLFPTKEEKLQQLNSKLMRGLWVDAFKIESHEGRNVEECISIANAAVDAYSKKFNETKINLN